MPEASENAAARRERSESTKQIMEALAKIQKSNNEREHEKSDTHEIALELSCKLLEALRESTLSDDERKWVRLAIQREAQSIKLRQAIIEKTLTGLAVAAMAWLGVIIKEYLVSKGLRL